MTDNDCVFCKIANGQLPAAFIYQDDQLVAFKDIHPSAPTHILIVPREHIVSLATLAEQHAILITRLIMTVTQIAREQRIEESGYRLVTNIGHDGGQSVFHLHWHLLGGRQMTWPPG